MEIVYDESTGTWGEREEPYTTLDVQTEKDWNKLEFMINNFSRLEEENKELKRLLRLAVKDIRYLLMYADYYHCYKACCRECFLYSNHTDVEHCINLCDWQHAEEALKLLGDDADD